MARKFYLTKRKNGIYYARIIESRGFIDKSTKTKDRDQAAAIVGKWLTEGVPVHQTKIKKPLKELMDYYAVIRYIEKSDIEIEQVNEILQKLKNRGLVNFTVTTTTEGKQNFIEYLYNFWDYDNSLYLRDKRAHGKSVTRRTCIYNKRLINRNYKDYFNGKPLDNITRNDLRNFGLELKERLSGKSVNNILHIAVTALKWAYREKMITEDITAGLGGFAGGGFKRGILTTTEIEKLKNIEFWEKKKAYIAFRLSSTSALRAGECMALRRQDIGDNVLYIRHNWNPVDGLKAPKNGEERKAYLLPEVRALLFELLAENPYPESPEQFVFYSDTDSKRACGSNLFSVQFQKAVNNAGIEFDGRKIDFHSLRHYVATQWADSTGNLRQVAKVTGHKNIAMVEHYANHENESEIIAMGKQAANILNFKQGA